MLKEDRYLIKLKIIKKKRKWKKQLYEQWLIQWCTQHRENCININIWEE